MSDSALQPELPPEPPVRPSRAGVKRARRARRRRRRIGVLLMVVGIGVAAAGVSIYLDGRSDGEVPSEVESDVMERTTTTAAIATTAPSTTSAPAAEAPPVAPVGTPTTAIATGNSAPTTVTTTPEPTVP